MRGKFMGDEFQAAGIIFEGRDRLGGRRGENDQTGERT